MTRPLKSSVELQSFHLRNQNDHGNFIFRQLVGDDSERMLTGCIISTLFGPETFRFLGWRGPPFQRCATFSPGIGEHSVSPQSRAGGGPRCRHT